MSTLDKLERNHNFFYLARTGDYKANKYYVSHKEVVKIKIYKGDAISILKLRNRNLVKIAFIMMTHAKQHEDDTGFYMTYEQMSERGVRTDNKKKSTAIKRLEELEYLTIVSRNKRKGHHCLPNVYKLCNNYNEGESVTVDSNINVTELNEIFTRLVTKEEMVKLVPDTTFYAVYNKHYQEKRVTTRANQIESN